MSIISSIDSLFQLSSTAQSPLKTINFAMFYISRFFDPPAPPLVKTIFTPNIPHLPITKNVPKDPWSENFKNVKYNPSLLQGPFHSDLEHFAKRVLSTPLSIGQTIFLRNREGVPATYTIHRKIAAEGLVSYVLLPKEENHPPILAFRCTEPHPHQEEGLNSVRNDIDPHIGEKGWKAAEKEFDVLMKDPIFKNILVTGYSLGGCHAQYFIAKHHEKVSRAIFYNDPSIDPSVVDQFAMEIEKSSRETPLIFQIFRNIGDPCHHFGGKHLGCDVDHPNLHVQLLEVEFINQHGFDTQLHTRKIFDTTRFNYVVHECLDPNILSRKLNNERRDPISIVLETLRKGLRHVFAGLINSIELIFHKFFKKS